MKLEQFETFLFLSRTKGKFLCVSVLEGESELWPDTEWVLSNAHFSLECGQKVREIASDTGEVFEERKKENVYGFSGLCHLLL